MPSQSPTSYSPDLLAHNGKISINKDT
jgi:hypothetical protein